jgi:hypothetical protein
MNECIKVDCLLRWTKTVFDACLILFPYRLLDRSALPITTWYVELYVSVFPSSGTCRASITVFSSDFSPRLKLNCIAHPEPVCKPPSSPLLHDGSASPCAHQVEVGPDEAHRDAHSIESDWLVKSRQHLNLNIRQ